MWLRLLTIAPAVSTQKTLMAFRVGTRSWSHNLRSTQAYDTVRLHDKISHQFPDCVSLKDVIVGYFMAHVMQFYRPLVINVVGKLHR